MLILPVLIPVVFCAVDLELRLADKVKPPYIQACEACAAHGIAQRRWY